MMNQSGLPCSSKAKLYYFSGVSIIIELNFENHPDDSKKNSGK